MRRKFGNLLMVMGAALVLGALALFLYNEKESADAELASTNLMPQLIEQIEARRNEAEKSGQAALEETESSQPTEEPLGYVPGTPAELLDPSLLEMTEVVIDGYGYVGYLSIPDLGLDLPVMGEWDYTRLRRAPCRYSGSVLGEDLVIMAHSYKSHFRYIRDLTEGALIYFADMDGEVYEYEVVAKDVLMPNQVEEMTAGDYDLTLFTCTYGGRSRMTVYCDLVGQS